VFYEESNTIDMLEKIGGKQEIEETPNSDANSNQSVSSEKLEKLEDTGEQLKLDLKGLRTTSTNKTKNSFITSGQNSQELKMSAMQAKIDSLENQLNSMQNQNQQFSSKPPLPRYSINDTNSKFLQQDLSNSPYLKVEQQMNEKKIIYNNYYSQPCEQEKELERKFKLEKFFKQQNDWWCDDLSQYNFGSRNHTLSRDFEEASAKELIRKRCELLREQRTSASAGSIGRRSRHDSYSSLNNINNNRVMSPNVVKNFGEIGINSTPVKQT